MVSTTSILDALHFYIYFGKFQLLGSKQSINQLNKQTNKQLDIEKPHKKDHKTLPSPAKNVNWIFQLLDHSKYGFFACSIHEALFLHFIGTALQPPNALWALDGFPACLKTRNPFVTSQVACSLCSGGPGKNIYRFIRKLSWDPRNSAGIDCMLFHESLV